jgi:hypothetical protein
MNPNSPLVRPLQLLAVGLGITIVVLGAVWSGQEVPPPTLAPSPASSQPSEVPVVAASARLENTAVVPAAETPPASASTNAPGGPQPPMSAVLVGCVKRPDGSLVKQGFLWLNQDGKNLNSAQLGSGTFVFAGLAPGTYQIKSRIDDELEIAENVTVTLPRTRFDITLPDRWMLQVNALTADGTPLLEEAGKAAPESGRSLSLSACAFREPLTGDLPPSDLLEFHAGLGAFRADDGFGNAARLPKQAIGVLTLPPGNPVSVALMLRNVVIAQQTATPGQAEITFTLTVDALLQKTATVKVRVVDEAGAPVVGARVALNDSQTSGGGQPTDAEGRVTLRYLKPGRLGLELWQKELAAPPIRLNVLAGADLDLGDIVMRKAIPVEISMANLGEKGSLRTRWLDSPNLLGQAGKAQHYSTDNGASQKLLLYPGRHSVLAKGSNGVALFVLDTAALPAQPIHIDLKPAADLRVVRRVTAGYTRITIRHESGDIVIEHDLSGIADYVVNLPPGNYEAELADASGNATKRSITLTPEGAVLTVP